MSFHENTRIYRPNAALLTLYWQTLIELLVVLQWLCVATLLFLLIISLVGNVGLVTQAI